MGGAEVPDGPSHSSSCRKGYLASNTQISVVVGNPSKRWYYHDCSRMNIVDDCTHAWFRDFLGHGTIWTGVSENAIHRSQRLEVKPLKSSDWPRNLLGPSWPSFPSISEWMGMLRRGIDPLSRQEYKTPEGNAGYTCVSLREVRENPYLATRIVANAIVGIRSSIEVPKKFLKYFRYRWNFLILTTTWCLPIGLVRFLLGQWCQNPYSLWLRRACTLKKFLRKTPSLLVTRAALRRALDEASSSDAGDGACTHPSLSYSESYSGGDSDLD